MATWLLRSVAAAGVGIFVSAGAACSDDERAALAADPEHLSWLESRVSASNYEGESCEPGSERECSVTLQQEGNIVSCYRGVQYCQAHGAWGDCTDGEITQEAAPEADGQAGLALLALSTVEPSACTESCDPACMRFVESSPLLGGSSGSSGSGNSCSHDTCTVAPEPLAATCGSCVATVCALDASCCTSNWDSGCVELAYTACLSRLPPLGLCDFGVFATAGVTTANRPSAGATIGSGADVTIGTDATPSRIVVKGNLTIQSPNGKNVTTPGGVWVGGSVNAQNGGGAKYTGDWNVGGSINLNGGNTVIGTVRARQSIQNLDITGPMYAGTTYSSVGGTGTRTSGSAHASPVIDVPTAIPTRAVTCSSSATGDRTIDKTTVTLPPGDYRDVTLQNGTSGNPSVLVLSAGGKYTFRNLTINSGCQYCKIQLGTATTQAGPWDVSVCQRAMLEGPNSYIAGGNGLKLTQPEKFILYVGGTDPGAWQYAAKIGNDFKFVGVLMVPNGTFRSEDRGTVNGALWAKAISAGTDLGATQISRDACEALNIPGTLPVVNACPIVTTISQPRTVDELVYQAQCPDGTAARWKNLTWKSTMPTGSSVTFAAKVANSVAELPSHTYTTVGTAAPGTPNTTTCSLFGPSPVCPVALTNQLGLGYNQGQVLSLRIEGDASGGPISVADWKVTYTCQFVE